MLSVMHRLHATLAAVAPITGVYVGAIGDSSTVRVTPASLQATVQAAINAFDWSQTAQVAWELPQTRQQALQLLALTDPTNSLAPVVWAVRGALYQTQDSLNALRPNKVDRGTGKQEIAAKVQSGEADS